MALQLASAVTDGFRRALTRTGGVLFVVLFATQLLLLASLNTVLAAQAPPEAAGLIGLTLPVSDSVAGALLLATLVLNAASLVVIARAYARPLSRLSSFPAALVTRRIGRATLSTLVGGTVVFVAVTIGLAFLFLPGIYLSACLLFFVFAVGVEDRGVVGSLGRAWSLSSGNRLRLAVVVVVVGVAGALVGAVPAVFQLAGVPALGDVVSALVNAVLFTFVYGVVAAAYLQVDADEGGLGGAGTAAAPSAGGSPDV
jgi:hypothetical protein